EVRLSGFPGRRQERSAGQRSGIGQQRRYRRIAERGRDRRGLRDRYRTTGVTLKYILLSLRTDEQCVGVVLELMPKVVESNTKVADLVRPARHSDVRRIQVSRSAKRRADRSRIGKDQARRRRRRRSVGRRAAKDGHTSIHRRRRRIAFIELE